MQTQLLYFEKWDFGVKIFSLDVAKGDKKPANDLEMQGGKLAS